MTIDRPAIRRALQAFDFRTLFIEELGWDHYQGSLTVPVGSASFPLQGVAQKRGMVVLLHEADAIPDAPMRGKIESQVAKNHRENFIIFHDRVRTRQVWLWTRREPGRPLSRRERQYQSGQSGEALAQKLAQIAFSLEEEEEIGLVEVTGRVRTAFDVERTTRRFYDDFRRQRDAFEQFVQGIPDVDLTKWYVSVMLNRLMFVYFIQKKGFLDSDPDYLRSRLKMVRGSYGPNQFNRFYRYFLLRLFHDGLGRPQHLPELEALIGRVPYLNGGIFQLHPIEAQHPDIQIDDTAFENIFDFFDCYQWHLDDRPLRNDSEINPDVLGYIFEKYINQKQMGAYYTKEDITDYIGKNAIIPFLFDRARQACVVAFVGEESVWALAVADPDRYIYPALRQGMDKPLPDEIAAGLDELAARWPWSRMADPDFALPTETWRETVARRQRYEEVRLKLAEGEVADINDFITLNLDVRQFAQDVINNSTPELLRAFWDALRRVSVLDPTCGSGAFLFAALNILEPLYEGCLERMRLFVEEPGWKRLHPRYAETFGRVLDDMARHPSLTYFITKSIIVNNLYGVDIMAEAVEIAKLRLFLKLASLVERVEDVEPLPDIDFNIRAGNTLVGYARREEVRAALVARPAGAGVTQGRMIFDEEADDLARIDEAAAGADRHYAHFRALQLDGETAELDKDYRQEMPSVKVELQRRLAALNGELDRALARQHGVDPGKPVAFIRWRENHQPFHWFAEFYGILHDGGFDVIIGNPPYVSSGSVEYDLNTPQGPGFSDLYAYVLTRSLQLTHRHSRMGMIVPLSVLFSSGFSGLRQLLVQGTESWFASFDNIPAAVFSGVSQRCTIWLGRHGERNTVYSSPMYRWRAEYRPFLTSRVSYVQVTRVRTGASSLPKVASSDQLEVLVKLSNMRFSIQGRVTTNSSGSSLLKFSLSARNYISAFIEPPPTLRVTDLAPVESSQIGTVALQNDTSRFAALAMLSGELFFWYWLTYGDGFHVTKDNIQGFADLLPLLAPDHVGLLSTLGHMLHNHRIESLVFKKNAGAYVGSYNYRNQPFLTRRADLVLGRALGLTREQVLAIFDYTARVLAINVYAGEKGIPDEIKQRPMLEATDLVQEHALLQDVDRLIREHFDLTAADMEFLLNSHARSTTANL